MQIYVQCVYENERFTIARNVHLLVTLRSRCWQNTVNIPPSQGRREVNRSWPGWAAGMVKWPANWRRPANFNGLKQKPVTCRESWRHVLLALPSSSTNKKQKLAQSRQFPLPTFLVWLVSWLHDFYLPPSSPAWESPSRYFIVFSSSSTTYISCTWLRQWFNVFRQYCKLCAWNIVSMRSGTIMGYINRDAYGKDIISPPWCLNCFWLFSALPYRIASTLFLVALLTSCLIYFLA